MASHNAVRARACTALVCWGQHAQHAPGVQCGCGRGPARRTGQGEPPPAVRHCRLRRSGHGTIHRRAKGMGAPAQRLGAIRTPGEHARAGRLGQPTHATKSSQQCLQSRRGSAEAARKPGGTHDDKYQQCKEIGLPLPPASSGKKGCAVLGITRALSGVGSSGHTTQTSGGVSFHTAHGVRCCSALSLLTQHAPPAAPGVAQYQGWRKGNSTTQKSAPLGVQRRKGVQARPPDCPTANLNRLGAACEGRGEGRGGGGGGGGLARPPHPPPAAAAQAAAAGTLRPPARPPRRCTRARHCKLRREAHSLRPLWCQNFSVFLNMRRRLSWYLSQPEGAL